MARRREDRVISCQLCGDVLAIFEEGARVPATPHTCVLHDALDRELYELEETLDEMRKGGMKP